MHYPQYQDKYRGQAILNPEDVLAYRQRLGRMPKVSAPEAVLICMQRGLPERMRGRIPLRYAGRLMGDLFTLKRERGRLAVLTNIGIGAPQIVALAEELIAWGVRRLVSLVWGGGIQVDLKPGDIVICERAIRDEGTSFHYIPPDKYVSADPDLVQRLSETFRQHGLSFQVGTSWTIDASYRETQEEIRQYQNEGVKTVEMEIAALLALGVFRQVETASVVVIGDSLAHLKWEAPYDTRPVERSLERAYAAILEALGRSDP